MKRTQATLDPTLSFTDLIELAKFKYYAMRQEEDLEIKLALRTQAMEIHLVLDLLTKEGLSNVGLTMPALTQLIPYQLKTLSTRRLMLEGAFIKDVKEIVEDVESNEAVEEVKKIDLTQLTLVPDIKSKHPIDVARAVINHINESGSDEEKEEDFIRLIKETVVDNIKKGVWEEEVENEKGEIKKERKHGRQEAVKFLRYAFKDKNWTDKDCHSFINQLKDLANVEEPPINKRSHERKADIIAALRESKKKA